METFKQSEWLQKWQSGYERLLEISQRQLETVKSAADDENRWEDLKQLTEERMDIQSEIAMVQAQLEQELGQDELKELFRQEIRRLAESARVLTFEAARKIETLMISQGNEINSTKTQRRVFNAYNGINSEDQISYFFDERK